MQQDTKMKSKTNDAKKRVAHLAGDIEALCAIIARIVTRLVSERQPRKAKT